jgi:hypothetical protein
MLQYNSLEQTTYTPEALQAMRSQGKAGKDKRIMCKANRKAHNTFRKQRQQRRCL